MYKAVIFDLDGTAIPNKREGKPSEALIKTVSLLHKKAVKVSAATGRPYFLAKPIIETLQIVDACIVSGGTQIVDPVSNEVLWEKDMDASQVEEIVNIALPYPYNIYFTDDKKSIPAKEKKIIQRERIIYIMHVNPVDTDKIIRELGNVPDIVYHRVISWTSGDFDIHITHKEATKKHALEILLEKEKFHKNEVVVAGDSNNDLPLFELAGYKIAMGNGSDELKKKADIIAPTAEEDGLANVLHDIFR